MPLDTRIALSGQPLQVQFRDPIASYNQLAQLTSADTQNQLAQMQMQEHQQMAPYRMQEAQTRAASAQLTYDQAKQAQDFITSVMTKAAEHPEAPQDPVEAAQQMLMHPNPQVQAVGGHLLDASQKVMTYKQQAQFLKDQSGGEPAPAVAPVVAPAVVPKAEAAPEMFVTKDNTGRARYVVNGVEVSPEDYQSAKANVVVNPIPSFGQQTKPIQPQGNALAPTAVAAPIANAMVAQQAAPVAPSAMPTSANLMTQINAGDRKYGEAKGWLAQRKLLEEQFKELVKPPVMHVVNGNLVGPNGNVVFTATPDEQIKEVIGDKGITTFVAFNPKNGTSTPVIDDKGNPLTGKNFGEANLGISQGNLAAHQNMVNIAQQRLNAEMQTGNFDPNTIDFMAQTYMQTGTIPPLGMGPMAAAARSKILSRASELSMVGGQTAAQAAATVAGNKVEQAGNAAGAKAVGTQIANVNMAAVETRNMIPTLQSYVAKVNPTDYPTLNEAGNFVAKKSGDPNVVAMAASMNALVNTYARAINPKGAPTVSDKEHAREILNGGMSKGQINAALNVIQQEMNAALASGPEVKAAMRPGAKAKEANKPATVSNW